VTHVVPIMGSTSAGTAGRPFEDRSNARRELIKRGISPGWCAAWEAEAERTGLRADGQYFWDAGRGWIDAQQAIRKGRAP
jgi:hypothetical protein